MSGIYIPGMGMPKEHITLEICPNGEVWEQNWQGDGTLVGKAVPVPGHGRWMKRTGMAPPEFAGRHYCSICGNYAGNHAPYGAREWLSNFCPNCGATMTETEEGEE